MSQVLKKISRETRHILSSEEKDFTSGKISKAVLYLSIPMILEMALESVFSVVDTYFVGKLGSDALAAVGITDALVTLIFALSIGISIGTTALVARRIGEKERDQASHVAAQALLLSLLISLPIMGVALFYSDGLLGLMGATPSVIETGSSFTQIILGGNITILLLFILNAVFRGAGNAVIAMRVLWISNGINIILDPILIFGWGPIPAMGVAGAAIATTIGRGIGVLIQLYYLFSGKTSIKLSLKAMRLNWPLMQHLVKISIGGVLQSLIATSSWIALTRLLAYFGSAALAGYTIAIRIILFALLPSWGMSNAAATLVGQNLGAKNPERAERAVWISGYSNLLFLGLVAIVFIWIPEYLVGFFTTEVETLEIGSHALRIISYGYGFYAFGMVITQAFNGAGDTMTPTKINFFLYWLIQIPAAYILSQYTSLQAFGVFWSVTGAEGLLSIVAIYIFKKGKWKTRTI